MIIVFLIILALFVLRRELTYLHIFQQEEYDSGRFVRWVATRFAVDKRATALLLVVWLLQTVYHVSITVSYACASVGLLALTVIESDPRAKAKKPLAMTQRAKRSYLLALLLSGGIAAIASILSATIVTWILVVQAIPFTLAIANLGLLPIEKRIQKGFWDEAHEKLVRLKPTTIGITGSYGKTSVKHILAHILGANAPTLSTPGSVNTPMGIARVVREELGPHHRFFICEMGAYGPGSIARLCRLAPPELAVITAIGPAHYERFKSLDAVVSTKFELANAAIEHSGKVIIAEEVLRFAHAAEFVKRHQEQVIVVGSGPDCKLRIDDYTQTDRGMEVGVVWSGVAYRLSSHLYGRHQSLNLGVAFAAACTLGVPPEDVQAAISSTPQISHRLEVKRQEDGKIIIDDAYNSNPTGFINGLQLLELLTNGSGRRVLVTPGMVELGSVHDEEHRIVGTEAGRYVDVLLAVLPKRIESFVRAFKQSNPEGAVIECASFASAREWMKSNLRPSDVVLLENDLPDLYEKRLSL